MQIGFVLTALAVFALVTVAATLAAWLLDSYIFPDVHPARQVRATVGAVAASLVWVAFLLVCYQV